jgi:ATP-dependent Clp protease protease subunit
VTGLSGGGRGSWPTGGHQPLGWRLAPAPSGLVGRGATASWPPGGPKPEGPGAPDPWSPRIPGPEGPSIPGPAGTSVSWPERVRGELFGRRVVLMRGELDDDLAGQVTAELMMLDATGDEPVVLHVDSTGGSLLAAFTVIDTMDLLGVPVEVVCVGRAEGAAVGVVAAGAYRYASPHAQLRLSEPSSSVSGSARDIEAWAAQHQRQLARYVQRLAEATGRPGEHIEADLATGRWLSAEEAVAYGLVDGLWRAGPGPTSRRPIGFGP